ncbi:MAG TPA: hypothetical protein VM238_05550 [Phycisphaerae bacterium]|nr:hypothetical protein [Phycisphaerae bacterium]
MAYTDDGNVFSAVVGEADDQTDSGAGGTGETFAIEKGQAITIDQDGLMFLACADTDATQMPCVGVATKRLVNGEMGTFVNRGYIRGVDDLTAPSRVYVSNTPGVFGNVAGDVEQLVGRSYAADDAFYFDPDLSVADDHTAES